MARHRTRLRRRAGALAAATAALALTCATAAAADPPDRAASPPKGHDVSSHQKNVDWPAAQARGARFVYVKATEATDYQNPYFHQQYDGARDAGVIRGAYHFALPDESSGAKQARYFVAHGGDWRADGWTLPPALDIEYNPYSAKHPCYRLGWKRMTAWIWSFSDELARETGRRPVIYTTAHWWRQCTGDSHAFASRHPLWVARHGTSDPGGLPGGWQYWTFWQYATSGRLPGDQNLFNGTSGRLRTFAAAGDPRGAGAPGVPEAEAEPHTPDAVTPLPAPVHLPFTQVAYVHPDNDLE